MLDSIRLYCRYVGISIRSQMQYRASFVMLSLGHLAVTFIEFLGLWALFDRFGQIEGWTLPEVALLYGVVHSAFALAEGAGRGFDIVHRHVRLGDFDRILLRPRSTVLQVIGLEFQLLRVGRLIQGLGVLVWSLVALQLPLHPAHVALLLVTVLGGGFMFTGLFALQAALSFWSVQSLELVNTVTYGGVETAQFPLSVYRRWFAGIFIYVVPLAMVTYLPVLTILQRPDPLGLPLWLGWGSLPAGVLFFGACLLVWQLGVRHYTSTGS